MAPNKSGDVARRVAEGISKMANNDVHMQDQVKGKGGIPSLVAVLESSDVKVQRAAVHALRTLAYKNEENKRQIVQHNALKMLGRILTSELTGTHIPF